MAWPGELVVRARAPGDGEEGQGFAGARPSTGTVRYLAADGTWSESAVVYASPVAQEGTLTVTPPLPVEGAWRFDALVRSSADAPRAVASAPVLVSSKPALRVVLSQSVAAEGDSVQGELVLARGSGDAARQVKVVAFWKGPDGAALPLPEGGPRYVFDGELRDVRLPVLGTRLSGVAPGRWTVLARMYDAETGALLSAGSASVEVCSGLRSLPGTAVGDDAQALGAGAAFSEVTALSLDRQEDVSTVVGSDGTFTLSLRPGRWLLSGRVEDGSGAHALLPRQVTVGCGVQEEVTLGTKPDTAPRRRRAQLPRAKVPRDSAPTPAPAPRGGIHLLVMDAKPLDSNSNPEDDAFRLAVADAVARQLRSASGNALATTSTKTLHGMLEECASMQRTGQDDTALMGQVQDLVGGHQVVTVNVRFIETGGFAVTLRAASGWPDVEPLAGQEILIPSAPQSQHPSRQPILDAVPGLVAGLLRQDLVSKLRERSDLPYNPVLKLSADFAAVDPASTQTVSVHLEDSDGTPSPGRTVYLDRRPVAFESEVKAQTDSNGDATFTVPVGVAVAQESLVAEYHPRSSLQPAFSQVHSYGIRRGQRALLKFNPGIPVIHPRTDYSVEVVAAEPDGGAPLTGQQVTVTADLGGSEVTTEGTTDGEGKVTVTVPVGPDAGLGEVTAALPSSAADAGSSDGGSAAASSITENRVVSSEAAFNVSGPPGPVGQGAVSTVKGTLRVDGRAQPGARVTLSSPAGGSFETAEGGGSSGRTSVALNEESAFEVLYQAPQPAAGQPPGTGTAVITATVIVDGAEVERTVNVTWGPSESYPIVLAGAHDGGAKNDVYTVLADGTGWTNLTKGAYANIFHVKWSPLHDRIAFVYSTGAGQTVGIGVINKDGSAAHGVWTVTQPSDPAFVSYLGRPFWTPDGLGVGAEVLTYDSHAFATVSQGFKVVGVADGAMLNEPSAPVSQAGACHVRALSNPSPNNTLIVQRDVSGPTCTSEDPSYSLNFYLASFGSGVGGGVRLGRPLGCNDIQPYWLSWSASGDKLFGRCMEISPTGQSTSFRYVVIPADGSEGHFLDTPPGVTTGGLTQSPDGSHFVSHGGQEPGYSFVWRADGTEVHDLGPTMSVDW